jgi:exopolyphosphatase/guanosine-5'-triphosphate,3'-diphosphate pyrophosphatase
MSSAQVAAVPAGPEAESSPSRIAVIDLGSNTARLVLFELGPEGDCRPIAERKEIPRLGRGVGSDLALSPEARARGVAALARFARALSEWGRPSTVGVATSAVRDAPNGAEFLAEVAAATGLNLRALTGAQEARYAAWGVSNAWELGDAAVVDLGGGSLQIVEARGGRLGPTHSLPLGALRLTQSYLEHDPPRRGELDELREAVRSPLRKVERSAPPIRDLYGVGGTLRALARASVAMREYPLPRAHGYGLGAHDLEALESILFEMPADRRRSVPGIGGDRAEVIVAGLVVVREVLSALGHDRITVSSTGIREGIALDAGGVSLPASAETLARRSVRSAVRRLDGSWEHSHAVERRALAIFDALRPRHELGASEALALSVGAWLHDLGESIELSRHAQHSSYLIQNLPLMGLTHRQVALAALAVEVHQGDELPERWHRVWRPVLDRADFAAVDRLGTILAVAERLPDLREPDGAKLSGRRLALRFVRAAEGEGRPRGLEKALRRIERLFDVEVDRGDG